MRLKLSYPERHDELISAPFLQTMDGSLWLYHAAGIGSFDVTLSWVLVVDGSKAVVSALADLEMAGPVPPSTADIQMAFLTVLGTRFLQCSALLQGPSL